MNRFSELEEKYVVEAVRNEFQTSKNSVFNKRMEEKFCELYGVNFSIGFVNGTQTMHTALLALGLSPGDEVIVPPLTMSSTSLAVLEAGCVPIFADVQIDTFNIDPVDVERKITPKTKAIISVALYGLPPDYDALLAICKKYNVALIEDNAETFLNHYKGRKVGTFGHFSSFSFQASKHITCGEGGMLVTDSEELADKARRFSSLGYAAVNSKQGKISKNDIQSPNYDRHVAIGFNYRMSEVNAAVILGQLERAEELVAVRVQSAKFFAEAISGFDFIVPQAVPEGYENSYWAYSFYLKTEDPGKDWFAFRDIFKQNGGDGFYAAWKLTYQEPLYTKHDDIWYKTWQKTNTSICPNAEYLQPRMIQLKTNYWVLAEAEEQAKILKLTCKEFKSRG